MLDEQDWREVKELISYFLNFVRNPIVTLKILPKVDWIPLIVVQAFSSAISCVLSFFFTRNLVHMFLSLLFVPITLVFSTYLISFIVTGYFKLFERREIPFLSMYTLVVISVIPYVVAFPLFSLFPPLALIACLCGAFSMIVGLVENFNIEKKTSMRIIGVLVAVFVVIWMMNTILSQDKLRELTMPHDNYR